MKKMVLVLMMMILPLWSGCSDGKEEKEGYKSSNYSSSGKRKGRIGGIRDSFNK
ncbi:MAG: hypothetical protein HQL50_11575 [Magnetococcales bacterium]|nr:hypothetical protein [Magnetococcales bacterium]